MAPPKKVTHYRAKHAFGVMYEGEQITIPEGEIVRAGHKLLKGLDEHFEPVVSFGRFDVEQATAAPGESRKAAEEPAARVQSGQATHTAPPEK
jgi:hypothetical protein